jgi:hypothetical protein
LRCYQEHFNYPFGRPHTEEHSFKISTDSIVMKQHLQNALNINKTIAKDFRLSVQKATEYVQNNDDKQVLGFDFQLNTLFPPSCCM